MLSLFGNLRLEFLAWKYSLGQAWASFWPNLIKWGFLFIYFFWEKNYKPVGKSCRLSGLINLTLESTYLKKKKNLTPRINSEHLWGKKKDSLCCLPHSWKQVGSYSTFLLFGTTNVPVLKTLLQSQSNC